MPMKKSSFGFLWSCCGSLVRGALNTMKASASFLRGCCRSPFPGTCNTMQSSAGFLSSSCVPLFRGNWNMMKSSAGFLWGYCLSLFLVAYDYEMTKPSSGVLWFSCRFLFPETCNKFQVTRIPLSTVAYELMFYLLNLGAKAPWKPYLLLVVLVASAIIEIL